MKTSYQYNKNDSFTNENFYEKNNYNSKIK